jgi:hypothetical protein
LSGGRNANVIRGGKGDDTMAGIWLTDEVHRGDRNLRNTFVFDEEDILDVSGFNLKLNNQSESMEVIRDNARNRILTFNWNGEDIADPTADPTEVQDKDWLHGSPANNDVIKLTGFTGIPAISDANSPAELHQYLNTEVFAGSLPQTFNGTSTLLSGDQRFFMVFDGTGNPDDDTYLLYDQTGDPFTGDPFNGGDTFVVTKLTDKSVAPYNGSSGGLGTLKPGDFILET